MEFGRLPFPLHLYSKKEYIVIISNERCSVNGPEVAWKIPEAYLKIAVTNAGQHVEEGKFVTK